MTPGLADRLLESGAENVARALALLFIASIPIENARAVQHHSLAHLTGFAAIGGTVFLILVRGRINIVDGVAIPALLFAGWATTSVYWSIAPGLTRTYVVTLLQLLLLLLVVWQNVTSRRTMRLALLALIWGSTIGSIMTILDRTKAHGGVARYAVGDPNDFGIMVAITAVMTLHLVREPNQRIWMRLFLAASLVAQIIAIARTASRTAAIAGVAGLVILMFTRATFKPLRLAFTLVIGVAAYFGIRQFVGSAALDRLGTSVDSAASGNLNNRTTFWHLAISLWRNHPFQGLGAGGFRTQNVIEGRTLVAHSVLVGVLTELGVIGLGLFIAIFVMALKQILRLHGADRRLWLAVFATWLGAGLTLTFELRKMTWVLIALAGAVSLMSPADVSPPQDTAVAPRPRRDSASSGPPDSTERADLKVSAAASLGVKSWPG